jgi:hypothetical protein
MSFKRTLIVSRDELPGVSATFLRAGAESLASFVPYFVGLRRRAGSAWRKAGSTLLAAPANCG